MKHLCYNGCSLRLTTAIRECAGTNTKLRHRLCEAMGIEHTPAGNRDFRFNLALHGKGHQYL
jgi:hypothetical protein